MDRYEEALERAKAGKPMDEVFPELKESEDERIRNLIYCLIRDRSDNQKLLEHNGVSVDEALAYLEKQKEPRHAIRVTKGFGNPDGPQFELVDLQKEQTPILEVFGFKVGDAVRLKDGDGRKHIIKSFEEVEGIHGPNFFHVEFEDNSARVSIYPDKEYPNGYYTKMEKFEEEQKPAEWSEEDEKNRRPLKTKEIKVGDIITYFKNGKKGIMLVSSFDGGIYPRCKWGIADIDGTAYGDWAPGSGPYYIATEKEKQQLYDTMPTEVKDWLKSLRPQPRGEIYQTAKHDLAIKFMNYLDENRPEGKMNLSNGECEDIDKAFQENDWAKILRYIEKYGK